ncbi:MAG: putative bifunctional diguanylate cyclase/phosphodiesterase [Gammaproteobacteria bacterium]
MSALPQSLAGRLLTLQGGLTLLLGIAVVGAIHVFAHANARAQAAKELATGTRVFEHVLASKGERLRQAAEVLAADFGFRGAVVSNDRATLQSALVNHGHRIGADVMMMTDLKGRVSVTTAQTPLTEQAFPAPRLLARAQAAGAATGIVAHDGQVHEMVLVPVRAPNVIGWVAMGFHVDDALAQELSGLTGLEVSFLVRHTDGALTLAGSSGTTDAATPVDELREMIARGHAAGTEVIPVADGLATWRALDASAEAQTLIVLRRPLTEALRTAATLRWTLFALIGLSTVLSLVGGTLIARGVTDPLRRLGGAARAISRGEYATRVEVRSGDEVGALARAFEHMREAIAARESTIMDLAYRDTLTGLPNRALLQERFQQVLGEAHAAGTPVSLLLLDLDDFQLVNGTLGHQTGDLLLKGVARRLQGILPDRAALLARLGGDEFALMLPGVDVAGAGAVAEAARHALEIPLDVAGQTIDVAGSLGVVTFPVHGDDFQTLLSRADLCVGVAKRTRAGYAIYEPGYDQSPERLTLLGELRAAIEGGQLELYYQPKIALPGGQPVQVEALVRWHHPVRGFVPPDQFIPFAEQTGSIRAITRWVLATGCAQLARWRARGVYLNLCVNVSARDLVDDGFPALVAEMLAQAGVAPGGLWLEITESAIMDDPLQAEQTLKRLDELGVHLSIDDFGTGYSSLAYLKRLPVDELKIDKTFVLNMDRDQDDAAIVRSTIDLGHHMGLAVVAEGVDHAETLALLAQWGCDIAQGYYISRPLRADALEAWFAERTLSNSPPAALRRAHA